jgi:hypothetical protein
MYIQESKNQVPSIAFINAAVMEGYNEFSEIALDNINARLSLDVAVKDAGGVLPLLDKMILSNS